MVGGDGGGCCELPLYAPHAFTSCLLPTTAFKGWLCLNTASAQTRVLTWKGCLADVLGSLIGIETREEPTVCLAPG